MTQTGASISNQIETYRDLNQIDSCTPIAPPAQLTGMVGFGSPIAEKTISKRRRAGVELFATVALAISLVIAATAVSIGMARAQAHTHMTSPFEPRCARISG
jgi:hypothetical protein